MRKEKKGITLSVVQNKGGVGKTRAVLVTSKFLAACGFKVLVIDLDFNNNSTSFFVKPEDYIKAATRYNIFKALTNEGDENYRLSDYILSSYIENIDILPSHRKLANFRGSTDFNSLNRLISTLNNTYDFIIMDTEPSYTNMIINAENASDFILSPLFLDGDSASATSFIMEMLQKETNQFDKWHCMINGYNHRFENSKVSSQREFIEEVCLKQLQIPETKFTPKETWFPWTVDFDKIKDMHIEISEKKVAGATLNPTLYSTVYNLCQYIIKITTGEDYELPRPEKF